MQRRLTHFINVLVLTTALSGLAKSAIAQTQSVFFPTPVRRESVAEAFDRGFVQNSRTFYENRTTARQLQFIFGPFPDNEAVQDVQTIELLYRDTLRQQVASDRVVRTPDLPNPFDTSLIESPTLLQRDTFETLP